MNCGEQWKHIATMVAVNFGFATGNLLFKKILDEGASPLVVIACRQAISTVFITPIAYFWERKSRPKLTVAILCQLFISALIGVTMSMYLVLLGLESTSATFASAFTNMIPVITFLLALPFGLEKVNMKSWSGRAKVLGTVVCIGGAMLLTLYKGKPLTNPDAHHHAAADYNSMKKKSAEKWAIASMLLIAGVSCWSSWFLLQARISKTYPCQYSSTAFLSFFSAVQSAVLAFAIERKLSVWVLRRKLEITGVIYAGVVGAGLCYVGMSWCVKRRGALFTSSFSPLVQIFVATFEISIFHERIYLGSVIGSLLVVTGLYVLLWGNAKEAEEYETAKQLARLAQARQEDAHCNL